MKVLIACEESQTVCIAFRNRGHEAYSNDIQDCSGGHPEWHLQMDCLEAIKLKKWDLIIAHPPCTYITNAGVRHLHSVPSRNGIITKIHGQERFKLMREACYFFNVLYDSCDKVCVENPVPHKYAKEIIGTYTQLIQPWQFGHGETKATCLWLKGLPFLKPTNIVSGREARIHRMAPGPERAKLRSKTFTGIAEAMASQWG
jgi:hypothetical protein